MRKPSKQVAKTANILSNVLAIVCEIVLLPLKVIKAICNVIEELHSNSLVTVRLYGRLFL